MNKRDKLIGSDGDILHILANIQEPWTSGDALDALAQAGASVKRAGSLREHLARLKKVGLVQVVGQAAAGADLCVVVREEPKTKVRSEGWRLWQQIRGIADADLPWRWAE